MRKNFRSTPTIIVLGSILSFTSCTKQPAACINVEKNIYDVGDEIQLTICSENAYKFSWSWYSNSNGQKVFHGVNGAEDGSTNENPVFVPVVAETYEVELRAQSKNQRKDDVITTTITVNNICYQCIKNADTLVDCSENYSDWSGMKAWMDLRTDVGYVCKKKQ